MKTKYKTTTIRDVAIASQTSIATASRVLSASSYPVNAATRTRILENARKLGYTTCRGISYSTKIKGDIGVIIPTLTNPFYNELVMGIESECEKHQFYPIFCSSGRDPEHEIQNLELLLRKNVQGVIISSLNEDSGFPANLIQRVPNLVFFDQKISVSSVSYVCFNHFEAGRMATEYLLLRGHRRICFASPPITRGIRRDLFNGYLQALGAFNVPFSEDNVLLPRKEQDTSDHIYDYVNGVEMGKHFLQIQPRPTAVFTINDSTAYGMLRCFMEAGIHVPEDVSIIGCDDLNTSEVTCPPLTTIHQPGYETGRLTCQILLNEISDKMAAPSQITLQPSVVERASVRML